MRRSCTPVSCFSVRGLPEDRIPGSRVTFRETIRFSLSASRPLRELGILSQRSGGQNTEQIRSIPLADAQLYPGISSGKAEGTPLQAHRHSSASADRPAQVGSQQMPRLPAPHGSLDIPAFSSLSNSRLSTIAQSVHLSKEQTDGLECGQRWYE